MSSPADSALERAQAHLLASAEVQRATAARCLPAIAAAADAIAGAFESGGKLLLCGNGGSAAQCQHIAAEFVGRLTRDFERRALPAIALTTDTALLTAFANDCGFEEVFARQVEALQRPGDVLIAVSTSGDSPNVVRAVEAARAAGLRTVALIGQGGRLAELAEVAEVVIAVPSTNTQHVQEAHLAVGHVLCDLVERRLFGERS